MFWASWVLSILPAALLVFSAGMKFVGAQAVIDGMAHLGWPRSMMIVLGVLELSSAAIYLIPKTAVLGAILVTGYMGGAIATQLRIGEPVYLEVAVGVAVWLALFMREPRLRALIPLMR